MKVPAELLYTSSHEWIKKQDDNSVLIGITDHAQNALGDIVFVELPKAGKEFKAKDSCGVIESVKAAADIYSPISGKVKTVNADLENQPDLINTQPYESWLFSLELNNIDDLKNLLSAEQYTALLGAE